MKEWRRWRLWILSLMLSGTLCIRNVECQSRGDEGDNPQSLGFDDVVRRHDGYVKGETPTIPQTSFTCSAQPYNPGLYADTETQCQVYHVCFEDRQESFLCGPGTNFNQRILACDFWYNFDCQDSPSFYNANADIGKVPNVIPGTREPGYPGYPGRPEQPPSGGSYPPRVSIPSPPPQRPDIQRPDIQRPQTPVFQPQPEPPRVPRPGIPPQQPRVPQPGTPAQPPRVPQPGIPPQQPRYPQPGTPPQPPKSQPPSFPPPFRPQPQPDPPRIRPQPPRVTPPSFQPPPFRPQPDPPRVPEYPSLPSGPGTGARQPYPPSVQQVDDDGYKFEEKPLRPTFIPPPPPSRPQTSRPQFPPVVSPPRVSRPPLTPPIIRQPEGSIPRPQIPVTVTRPDYHPDANLKGNVQRPQQPRIPQPSTGYPSYPVPQRPVSPRPIPQRPVGQRPAYVPPPSIQQEHIEPDYIPPPPPPQQPQRPPYIPPPQPQRPPYIPPPQPQRPPYVPPPQPQRPPYVPPPQPQRPPYVPPQQPQRPPPQQPQRPPYVPPPPPPQQPSRPPYVPQPRPVQQEVTNGDFPQQPQKPYVPPIPQRPIDPDYGRPQPPVSPSIVRPVGRPPVVTGGQPPVRPKPVFPPPSDHPNSNIKGGPGYNQPPPQIPRFEPTRIGRPSSPQPVPRPRPDQSINALRPVSDKRPSASVSGGVKTPQQERVKKPSEPVKEIYQPPISVVDHPRNEIKGEDYGDPVIPQPPRRIPSPSTPVSGVKVPQSNSGRKQPQRPRAPVVVSRPQPPSLPTTTVKRPSPAGSQLYEKPRPLPPAPQPGRIKQPSQPQGQRTSQPRFPSHQPVDHPNVNVKGGDYSEPSPQISRPSGPPSSPSTSYEQRQTSGRGYPRGDPGLSQQQVIQKEFKPQRIPQSRPSGVKTIGQKSPSASQQNIISKQPRPEYDTGSSYTSGPDAYPKPEFGQPNSPYQPISTPSRSSQTIKQGLPSQNTITQTVNKPNYQGSPATTGLGSQVKPDPSYNRIPGHQPANQPQVFPHRDNPDHPNESLKGSGAYRPPPPAGFQAAASEVEEQKAKPEPEPEPAVLLGDIGAE